MQLQLAVDAHAYSNPGNLASRNRKYLHGPPKASREKSEPV